MTELNILDLFSGTGSWVKNWYDNRTYKTNIDSVDIVKRPHINYAMDVKTFYLEWQRNFKPKVYHIFYASPPCNHFSQFRKMNKVKVTKQDLEESLELVNITFKLAKKAKFCYVIENPATGSLPDYFPDEKYQLVDYSEYDFPLRKRTAIWSNIDLKLKTKKDLSYNDLPISYLSQDEKWSIPKKLTDRIKWIILKTFKQQLKTFYLLPNEKNLKFPSLVK